MALPSAASGDASSPTLPVWLQPPAGVGVWVSVHLLPNGKTEKAPEATGRAVACYYVRLCVRVFFRLVAASFARVLVTAILSLGSCAGFRLWKHLTGPCRNRSFRGRGQGVVVYATSQRWSLDGKYVYPSPTVFAFCPCPAATTTVVFVGLALS